MRAILHKFVVNDCWRESFVTIDATAGCAKVHSLHRLVFREREQLLEVHIVVSRRVIFEQSDTTLPMMVIKGGVRVSLDGLVLRVLLDAY